MKENDSLDRCEPDSRTFEFVSTVQSLERPEKPAFVLHVEAGAVILHEIDLILIVIYGVELDDRLVGMSREFPGIPQQVLNDRSYHYGVGIGGQFRIDSELDIPARIASLQFKSDLCSRLPDPYRSEVQLAPGYAGKLQQGVYQPPHFYTAPLYSTQVVLARFVQPVGIVLHQGVTESFHRSQRGA